jgi:hypothetical protein
VHTAAPVDALYLPATHWVQVPPSGPDAPVLQVQLVKAGLATGELENDGQVKHTPASAVAPIEVEYFPVTQFVHAAVPVSGLYVPATHCVHGPPFDPDAPALQVQLV